MMYWMGQILALAAGLFGIAIIRLKLRAWLPKISEVHLDLTLILLLFVGIFLSAYIRTNEVEKSKEFENALFGLREYSSVAKLRADGETGNVGAGLKESSRLIESLEGAWVVRGENYYALCTEKGMGKYYQATREFPKFPLSYYGIAACLHKKRDAKWLKYAKKAVNILEFTTQLDNHHQSHDDALNELRGYLSNSEKTPNE